MKNRSIKLVLVISACVLLCEPKTHAYYPSLTISPESPDIGDTISVTLEGLVGPSSCWDEDSSFTEISGDTLRFFVFLSNTNGGSCPQFCLGEGYPYLISEKFTSEVAGVKRVEVYERNEDVCFQNVDENILAENYFVGNPACIPCVAGDANGDGSANIADATHLIAFIFGGGAAPLCPVEGDANGDGDVNIADVTELLAYIFSGGALAPCLY